jgi:high-affinity iron transporter
VSSAVAAAQQSIDLAEQRLSVHASGPWVTFILTTGILMREGFEAVLILIALLAVIRAANDTTAEWWVHGGWITAVGAGVVAWFLSGWLMAISGVQRELLEGITALLAVAVLLYVGFWLHSRTEITRWRHFLDVQVRSALEGKKLWVLFTIAFMALFREAFECVLFLRAITLEGGASGTTAMLLGVAASFVILFGLSWALLRYSARIPIRRIFTFSSLLMAALAVILVGKGLHALQETGILAVTSTGWNWSSDLLGIYATWQTLIPQVVTVGVLYTLWVVGKRPSRKTARVPSRACSTTEIVSTESCVFDH